MSKKLFEQILKIVLEAGSIIQNVHHVNDVHSKIGAANFVTEYDSKVQAFLFEQLSEIMPEATFLGEEDGLSENEVDDGYVFIIDPIDGTTNFICDLHTSAISVALAYQKEVILGIVYNPYNQDLFYAQKGEGAFYNGRPMELIDRSLMQGVINMGMTPYNEELRDVSFELMKEVSYHTMDIRELGCAAIGICYIALNRLVGFASPRLAVWDYAAAGLILEEAGGMMTNFKGEPLHFDTLVPCVFATPTACREFVEISKKYVIPKVDH